MSKFYVNIYCQNNIRYIKRDLQVDTSLNFFFLIEKYKKKYIIELSTFDGLKKEYFFFFIFRYIILYFIKIIYIFSSLCILLSHFFFHLAHKISLTNNQLTLIKNFPAKLDFSKLHGISKQ